MPLYEYQCENCGDRFELIEKFSAEPLTVHEKCGGKVHRLISAPALQFKGSGWYITDYAKSGSNLPASSGGKKESEGSSSEKSEKSEKKDSAAKTSGDSGSSGSSSSDSGSSSSSSSSPATTTSASTSDKK